MVGLFQSFSPLVICISNSSVPVIKYLDIKQVSEKTVSFVSVPEEIQSIHHDREGMAAGAGLACQLGSRVITFHPQTKEKGLGARPQSPPLVMYFVSKVQPPKSSIIYPYGPPCRDQEFKYTRLWETFYLQTTLFFFLDFSFLCCPLLLALIPISCSR